MGHTAGRLLQRGPESGEGMQQSKWMSLMGGQGECSRDGSGILREKIQRIQPGPFPIQMSKRGAARMIPIDERETQVAPIAYLT
ncbi:hypothetical protein [Mucilaginibacter sp. L3T2-6]|uniref:hypothetical protein n=1 Tax=Mucilaginibacter sp. L3T2-6 TaxID=3062491 RepID=UPI0026748576|nr:hypothetical protein [Mucilaginibacter sp. L3T2-6]MDO3643480.1 hypothetical protein [Mucilaginibacter sp. L3T2-6]MDV6215931.1 hypothetical protein [Mucilaginibacter sp. L3T2-6]